VGESGAGKSTLAALLLGLLAPSSGRLLVGSADLSSCDLEAWRRLVAWVPQLPTLFRGSVADNVGLGYPRASAERVREACALAGADGFISSLPDGYDTIVGEGGHILSPGERRRIAIARAFLRDAPLVVLDEPTADLDSRGVEIVSEAVQRLQKGRTVLLIAHRREVVRYADRVARLVDGRIAAPVDERVALREERSAA
jgi:ABC-type multidrug transport system fused ATPase/permease subunit